MPGTARWRAALEYARELLAQTASEMQGYYDDRSDRWQESEQAENLLERIETLEDLSDQVQEAHSQL
jgi:hypothetical protein